MHDSKVLHSIASQQDVNIHIHGTKCLHSNIRPQSVYSQMQDIKVFTFKCKTAKYSHLNAGQCKALTFKMQDTEVFSNARQQSDYIKCKTPKTHEYMSNYDLRKSICLGVDFWKLALVCSMMISGAWYACHTLAERVWRHNYVAIATWGSELDGVITSRVWSLSDNLKTLVAMLTKLWRHTFSARIWNAYHATEIIMLHTIAIFKKSTWIFPNK